jgi:hypothetical protein
MHHDEGLEPEPQRLGQDMDEIRVAQAKPDLADPDAEARSDGGELGEIAIGAQGEHAAMHWYPACAQAARHRCFAVEADQAVASELVEARRHAMPLEIGPMRVEAEPHLADAPREERVLRRAHHADRDVGIAAKQILVAVRERELDDESGVRLP